MRTDNTLCLIIDIQTRLVPAMVESTHYVEKSVQLLTGLQVLGVPLLATEQYPKGLGNTVPEIAAFLGENAPVEKTQFSAYLPNVAQILHEKNIENVIVIGGETHVCVLQTVLDLCAQGYAVHLPFECVSSRNLANKNNALEQMRVAGAVVSNVESLLFMLLNDAKHPAFKTISTLIQ